MLQSSVLASFRQLSQHQLPTDASETGFPEPLAVELSLAYAGFLANRPSVEWRHNARDVDWSRWRVEADGQICRLICPGPMSRSDEGTYSCVLRDPITGERLDSSDDDAFAAVFFFYTNVPDHAVLSAHSLGFGQNVHLLIFRLFCQLGFEEEVNWSYRKRKVTSSPSRLHDATSAQFPTVKVAGRWWRFSTMPCVIRIKCVAYSLHDSIVVRRQIYLALPTRPAAIPVAEATPPPDRIRPTPPTLPVRPVWDTSRSALQIGSHQRLGTASQGGCLTLRCQVPMVPTVDAKGQRRPDRVEWLHNGRALFDSQGLTPSVTSTSPDRGLEEAWRRIIAPETGTVWRGQITSNQCVMATDCVQMRDAGEYTCRMQFGDDIYESSGESSSEVCRKRNTKK
ncbi:unnamed protein product [Protopolystoma xenopodis]|uniref:Ig-like domain-containing protein n=1 Tax=Protopolystoma xenopodis TaxID=117903 RepID=A0A448XHW5_9PLAT|nr:unnamed protein product [Protopolystoma xenopodis]